MSGLIHRQDSSGVLSVMLVAIWYYLNYLENAKNTHRKVLLFVIKVHFSMGVFHFSKLYKWYQIAKSVSCLILSCEALRLVGWHPGCKYLRHLRISQQTKLSTETLEKGVKYVHSQQ